jgi:O-antigen/teichoic acid export membrane protein
LWRDTRETLLTAGAQTAIQALGFLSGLIVLRWLPVREYAYYTIANAALGMMTVIADSGICNSILAQGGQVWQDRNALGGLIAAGLALRRRLAVVAAGVAMPVLYLLLRRQGAVPIAAVLVATSILPLFVSAMTGQLLQIPSRLHRQSLPLQRIQLNAAALRVALVLVASVLFPVAWLVSACAGLAQSWANWRTRNLSAPLADLSARPEPEAWSRCVRQVRRSAPSTIYYAFEGQVTVWLVAIFGNAASVAAVGALSRLAMVLTIGSATFSLVWVPRFARMSGGAGVRRAFWLTQLAFVLLFGAVVALVCAFPRLALSLLGQTYASLTQEVVLAAAGTSLALCAGCTSWMAASRGVIVAPWLIVPFALLVQAVLVISLPMSTVSGVLWLGILSNLAYWGVHTLNFGWASRRRAMTAT